MMQPSNIKSYLKNITETDKMLMGWIIKSGYIVLSYIYNTYLHPTYHSISLTHHEKFRLVKCEGINHYKK